MYKDKRELRHELALRRKALADKHIREEAITDTALALLHGNILVYISMKNELSTTRLISELLKRSDATVYVPYTANGEITPKKLLRLGAPDNIGNLQSDCYGQTYDGQIDFCVTPLLAFNDGGYRIGYGKGCYDKYFKTHADRITLRVGLAFDCQHADFVIEAHDIPLDCCITESGVVYFNNASNIG